MSTCLSFDPAPATPAEALNAAASGEATAAAPVAAAAVLAAGPALLTIFVMVSYVNLLIAFARAVQKLDLNHIRQATDHLGVVVVVVALVLFAVEVDDVSNADLIL